MRIQDKTTLVWITLFELSIYDVGAIVAVIVCLLDLQLPMQSVPITTDVVNSNLDQSEVYNIIR